MSIDSKRPTADTGPARPTKLRFRLEQLGGEWTVSSRSLSWRSLLPGLFLLLWLAGWTVGCAMLAQKVFVERETATLLFAVPFWASWLFVASMVLVLFFSREIFVLGPDGVLLESRVLAARWSERRPLSEVRELFMNWESTSSDNSSRVCAVIEVRTLGRRLRFGRNLDEPQLTWLVWQLESHLTSLRDRRTDSTPAPLPPPIEIGSAWTVEATSRPVTPPSDCQWERSDDPLDFDSLVFVQRGRWSTRAVGAIMFLNLFWNGIVGLFVLMLLGLAGDGANMPEGPAWWGLLLFLLPFEAVGLVMFAVLLLLLFEPIRRTILCFAKHEFTRRWQWLGVGRTQSFEIERLARLDIFRRASPKPQLFPLRLSNTGANDDFAYELRLIDKQDSIVATLAGLTEGEARWIGDAVVRGRGEWFR